MPDEPTTTETAKPEKSESDARRKAWATRRANAAKKANGAAPAPSSPKTAPSKRKRAPKPKPPTAAEKYRERLEHRLAIVEALEQLTADERREVLAAVGVTR